MLTKFSLTLKNAEFTICKELKVCAKTTQDNNRDKEEVQATSTSTSMTYLKKCSREAAAAEVSISSRVGSNEK